MSQICFNTNQILQKLNELFSTLEIKHSVYLIEDIHNSWLYCFTNPLELGTRVSLSHYQPYMSWTQKD